MSKPLDRAAALRLEQGLPEKVEDQGALDRVARIVLRARARQLAEDERQSA